VQAEPGTVAPPEEFRNLTAGTIIAYLLSGREPAELVNDGDKQRSHSGPGYLAGDDSLRSVRTEGYMLYRTRHLGQALATLGQRISCTVRTPEAMAYRLQQDPLGPCRLAAALVNDSSQDDPSGEGDQSPLLFSLAEIGLMLAHVGRRVCDSRGAGEPDFMPLFREVIGEAMSLAPASATPVASNLGDYLSAVKSKCEELVGPIPWRDSNAR
jgi:hypothetical protein